MNKLFHLLTPLLFFTFGCILAQEANIEGDVHFRETGIPFIHNITPKEHGESVQNFSIVQAQDGLIYVANAYAVLEYDGVRWRVIPSSQTANISARSVNISPETNTVYVGAEGDFGFLAHQQDGTSIYQSLLEHVPEDQRDFKDVWNTCILKDAVFFQTADRIFRWQNNQMTIIPGHKRLGQAFVAGDQYFTIRLDSLENLHLAIIDGDTLKKAPGGDFLVDKVLITCDVFDDDHILIGTNKGFFLYNNGKFSIFPTQADKFLEDNGLKCSTPLPNGQFAFGTQKSGVLVLDRQGRIRHHIDESIGLRNNVINEMTTDREGGLWLALNNGMARVETSSALSIFMQESQFSGSVNEMIRYHDRLYIASSAGVFWLKESHISEAGNFVYPQFQNPVTGEIWGLSTVDDALLLATEAGTYQIVGDDLSRIPMDWGEVTYSLHQDRQNPQRVFAGLHNGLGIMEKINGSWKNAGIVPGVTEQIRTMGQDKNGDLWLGTQFRGVVRVDLPDGKTRWQPDELIVHKYDKADGMGKMYVGVYQFNDRLAFTTENGLKRYNPERERFYPDSTFGVAIADTNNWVFRLQENGDGSVWVNYRPKGFQRRELLLAIPGDNGSYLLKSAPMDRLRPEDLDRVYSIYVDKDQHNNTWFGGPEGIVRYTPSLDSLFLREYTPAIRKVIIEEDSLLYGGSMTAAPAEKILDYETNSIRFEFAAQSYEGLSETRYQTQLAGFDKGWSDWSDVPFRAYTNLPENNYIFRVRSRNVYGTLSNEGTFAFQILPPWYRTWWAYLLYVLSLGALIYGLVKVRLRAMVAQQKQLEDTVKTRTRDLNERNGQLQSTLEELQKTQKQLVVREKLASLGELTAGIAHEIKNPLNFINNFSDLSIELTTDLKEELEPIKEKLPADLQETVTEILDDMIVNAEKIHQHGTRADNIVKGMLMHSRGKTGQFIETDVNALLDEYVNLSYHGMRAQNSDFNITIHKDYDQSLTAINVVPQDLSRAFLNILNNGCYAAYQKSLENHLAEDGEAPAIWVSTHNVQDNVEIRIRDNGKGIPDDLKVKIFNPFFTTKPTGVGTGLGLSITHEIIVQEHHGHLSLNTESGKFTEFVIQLPKK